MKTDVSTNKVVEKGFVEFKCPSCLKGVITRSTWARASSKSYECPDCGFVGP